MPKQCQNLAEEYLGFLCQKTFLSLWSYPNVYRDQRIKGKDTDGKEVCDLLVIFGNKIIIFSVKYCEFPTTTDQELNWQRWFRKTIQKSNDQLRGAERWILNHPDRLFLDRACQQPLPLPVPDIGSVQIHRIVVALGAGKACVHALGGSESMMIHYDVRETLSQKYPSQFTVEHLGRNSDEIVHVLDDNTLNIVLGTLDTISDFGDYLERKESLLRSGVSVIAAGEEDLLAYYLQKTDASGEHTFSIPSEMNAIFLDEGFWDDFKSSEAFQLKRQADRSSYYWDELIEIFNKGGRKQFGIVNLIDVELVLRKMATEKRYQRRGLINHFRNLVLRDSGRSDILSRTLRPTSPSQPFYLFMTLRQPSNVDRDEYVDFRLKLLIQLCHAVRARYTDAKEVVGIAGDLGATKVISFDVFFANLDLLSGEEVSYALETAKMVGLHRSHFERRSTVFEYPTVEDSHAWNKGRKRNSPCYCGSGLKYKHCCGKSPAASNP